MGSVAWEHKCQGGCGLEIGLSWLWFKDKYQQNV
jgi:hypothetical protein